jgi:hypothetical protein
MTTAERIATAAAHRLLPAIAVAAVAAGCGSAPATSPPPPTPVVAEAAKDPFVLRLELPKADWKASETITGEATLSLVGVDKVKYGAGASKAVFFSFNEVDGEGRSAPAVIADCCHETAMEAAHPLIVPLQGDASYSVYASPSEFQRWFMTNSRLQLPVGT